MAVRAPRTRIAVWTGKIIVTKRGSDKSLVVYSMPYVFGKQLTEGQRKTRLLGDQNHHAARVDAVAIGWLDVDLVAG